jgi:hypothetical protein
MRSTPLENNRPTDGPLASDLSPVGIASDGAALRVSQLKVLRDLYYIAERRSEQVISDFKHRYHDALANPAVWEKAFHDRNMKEVVFVLGADRFLALGDNSAKSKDSRLWEQEGFEYYVKRELLIGKALYIYWPDTHYKLRTPWFSLPYFPNFPKMGFIK